MDKSNLLHIRDSLNNIVDELYGECEPIQASFRLNEIVEELEEIIDEL